MSQRLDFFEQSPELTKILFEFSGALKKSSLGNTLIDLVNIRASQINGCAFCLDMRYMIAFAPNSPRCGLPWSHNLEHSRSINEAAVLHHIPDPPRIANVCERIGVQEDQVCPLSHFDRAQVLFCSKDASSTGRTRLNRLSRRQSGGD